ncbi:10211_t:CDS:1 [Paraglomus occultum]|uniref:10211_t:CDS:1 n=1 Tax=Paraglomus occultum TaxID=144539 RepID=A0A9N9CJZ0_9GLOM|nr:10211_t:CDS:1 [Paraglomus occultum]
MRKFLCINKKKVPKEKKDADFLIPDKTSSVSSDATTATIVTPSLASDLEKLNLTKDRLNRYIDEAKESGYVDAKSRAEAAALRENEISKAFINIERSLAVDLCFVLDCTHSMKHHLAAAKDCILQVANYVENINPRIQPRVGFCGYRDHFDPQNRLQIFSFTNSYEEFSRDLANVRTLSGKDIPEDVLGGLDAAVEQMAWGCGTRILFHIGDAPPHGRRFTEEQDKYPDGDPHGLTAESVLNRMQEKNIIYFFGKVTSCTDKMIEVFNSIIGEFPVFDLVGGDPTALIDKFVKASFSAIASSVTLTSSLGVDSKEIYSLRRKKLELNTEEPDWTKCSLHRGVILRHRYPIDLSEIKDHQFFDKSHLVSQDFYFMMAAQPFSAGTEKCAYFGLDANTTRAEKIVLKEYFSTHESNPIEDYLTAVEVSAIARYLSAVYNMRTRKMVKKVRFLEANLLRSTIDYKTQYYTTEPRLQGAEFKRFNVNSGMIVELHPSLEAFAHFTYVYTKKYLVVYDLQGIELDDQFILTDPAIHCVDPLRFGKTNLGSRGISECFLANHQCNYICERLGLSSESGGCCNMF